MNSSVQVFAKDVFNRKIKESFMHVILELETQENLALGLALLDKDLDYFTKEESLLQAEFERIKKEIFSDLVRLIRMNLENKSSII
jgi:hypothetical protein